MFKYFFNEIMFLYFHTAKVIFGNVTTKNS